VSYLLCLCAWVAPAATGFPFAGVNAGAPIWGGTILFDAAKADAIAATGCRAVRLNFRLDGNTSWNTALLNKYDTIVNTAAARGFEVLGILCNEIMPVGQSAWNDDPDGDGQNAYVTGFSTTAYMLIDRYKDRIKRFEIWNEPDAWTNPNYASDPRNAGGTYMLPRVYARLLTETYLQCNWYDGRRLLTDHGVSLCTGGLFAHEIGGSNPYGFSYQYMGDVYAQAVWDWMQSNTGRRYPWDLFGYHFYLHQGTSFSASQLASYLNAMQARKAANGDAAPILVTEFGWRSDAISESLQAANLRDAFNYLKGRADVARAYWYQWQDEPGGAWGIVRGDGSPKPAHAEFAALQVFPPAAAFSATPTTGLRPLTVRFTDESTGPITDWLWEFGDGTTSSQQHPSHTYAAAGLYTVTLTVTGPGGQNSHTRPDYIVVEAPVAADFNEDGDVDVGDFGFFQACYNGPERPVPWAECAAADLDGDGDVDVMDFSKFQVCFNGANAPPACP